MLLQLILWILLAALAIGVAEYCRRLLLERRVKASRFARRRAIAVTEVYPTYYGGSDLRPESVIELWTEVANALGLDPTRLRPTDRFDSELRTYDRYYSCFDDLDCLVDALKSRCETQGIDFETLRLATLDDFIRTFAQRFERPPGAGP